MSVSVIITAHNAASTVSEAISSVLAQDEPAAQVLVIDDGSTDATGRLARRFPVHYVRMARPGLAAARNRGVELARGEFIAFLDAGDLWMPAKLRRQLAAFDDDPALDLVGEHAVPGHALPGLYQPASPEQCWSALLIRRVSFLRVGMFYTGPDFDETVDWFVRARRADVKMGMIPDVMLRRCRPVQPIQPVFQYRRAA